MTKNTHQSLERGLAVLEFVASAGRPVTLAETARYMNLHRSTVHHMMRALVHMGHLKQHDVSHVYERTGTV